MVPPVDVEHGWSPGSVAAIPSPLLPTGRWVASPQHLGEEGSSLAALLYSPCADGSLSGISVTLSPGMAFTGQSIPSRL